MNMNGLSPLPLVNLYTIAAPEDGFIVPVPPICRRHFEKLTSCREHYEQISRLATKQNVPVQCPFGFSSFGFDAGKELFCLTSMIPFPRLGGEEERRMAKAHPDNKITSAKIVAIANTLREVDKQFSKMATEIAERQSMALHEIRKLNRNIKHEAERMCSQESPNDPAMADSRLVKIWKSSELMSTQFNVIEFLANEEHSLLPLNSAMEIYRLFDMCVRIYRPEDRPNRLRMEAPYGFKEKIHACDKTFQLIPTILIENALKYSPSDTEIVISFSHENGQIVVTVRNVYQGTSALTNAIFKKGVRETKTRKKEQATASM